MKRQPFVSIIMPAFNAGSFLRDSIESILHQTYNHFELIIVDDASVDESPKIIQEYARTFPHLIKAVILKRHHGDSSASNIAYRKSKGAFIARMDADDIAHPKRIEKQVAFLLSHPKVMVVGTQGLIIDKHNQVLGEKNYPLTHEKIYEDFGVVNAMMHPSCMFRKSKLSKKKLYEDVFPIGDDYLTFFKLLEKGLFANLPERLHYYRIHGRNSSLKNPKKQFFFSLLIRKKAWQEYHYRMKKEMLFVTLLQILCVALLPFQTVVPLYMLVRGIYSPRTMLKKLIRPIASSSMLISPEA